MSSLSAHVPGLMSASIWGAQDEQELPVRGSLDVLAAMQFREVLFVPQLPIARVVVWQRRGGEQVVCGEHVVDVVP